MTRKLYVKSYGCQMNVYDSHRMADTLAPEGYVETGSAGRRRPDHPQHLPHPREGGREGLFRARPHARSSRRTRRARAARVTIAVAGCVAQAEGEEIIRRAPAVDLVVGPQSYHRLPDLLARAAQRPGASTPNFRSRTSSIISPPPSRAATRARGVTAFVTVQEGCDKFCTFCVVPYTRGAEVSRPVAKIVAEVERLADAGVREVTLIGQNVNAYHGEDRTAAPGRSARLLRRARRNPGHRAPALHHQPSARHGRRPDRRAPRPAAADAAAASAGAVRLRPHSRRHEPPPHARRLSARRSTRLRAARPDIALTLGFHRRLSRARPRTISRDTLRLVDEVGYAGAFSFKYSPRPGHARRPTWRADRRGREGRAPRAPAGGDRPPRRPRSMRAAAGATFDVLFEKPGRHAGPDRRPLALSAAGAGRWRRHA